MEICQNGLLRRSTGIRRLFHGRATDPRQGTSRAVIHQSMSLVGVAPLTRLYSTYIWTGCVFQLHFAALAWPSTPFFVSIPGQTALSSLFFNFYLTPLDSSMLLFWSYWLLEGCRFIAWRTAKGSRKPMLVDNGTGRVILFNVFHVSNASASLKASSFPGLRVLLHRFVVCSVFLPVGGRQAGPHFCGHNPTLSKGSAECSIKKDTTFLSGEMPRIHSLAFGFPVSPPTNETTDTSEWEYTDLVRKSIQ